LWAKSSIALTGTPISSADAAGGGDCGGGAGRGVATVGATGGGDAGGSVCSVFLCITARSRAGDKPGPYAILVRWHPGYMSAPHTYVTDRLCFVISGTWWVNSGEAFEPENTVPAPSGSFVRRVAHTPHYDGVKKGGKEPAVIGIIGVAPIELKLVDPSKPPVREV
jgi:hypothetical protein